METFGQTQTVPRDILEDKIGHALSMGDSFETKTGTWKVIGTTVDDNTGVDLLTIERNL